MLPNGATDCGEGAPPVGVISTDDSVATFGN